MRIFRALVSALLIATIAGCAAGEPDDDATQAAPSPVSTPTATPTPTPTPSPTPTPTPTPTPSEAAPTTSAPTAAKPAYPADVTDALLAGNERQPWASTVISATQLEPAFIEVETTILDPRGGTTGSPEAQAAIDICNAASALLESQGASGISVRVYESNGSTFAYRVPPGNSSGLSSVCTEY